MRDDAPIPRVENGIPRAAECCTERVHEPPLSFSSDPLPPLVGWNDGRRHPQLAFAIDGCERHFVDRGARAKRQLHAAQIEALLSDLHNVVGPSLQIEASVGTKRDPVTRREAVVGGVYADEG